MFSTLGTPILFAALLAASVPVSLATTQSDPARESRQSFSVPLKLDEVIDLIKNTNKDPAQLSSTLTQRGVDFDLDARAEKKLRKAGADDDMLYGIWQITPNGKAHMKALLTTPSGVELQVASSEALAFQDIQNESEPDHRLRMVGEFEEKFPNSPLRPYALHRMACIHFHLGRFQEAGMKWEELVRRFEDDVNLPFGIYMLGEMALRQGEYGKAISFFSQIAEKHDLRMDSQFKIIWCLANQKQDETTVARSDQFLMFFDTVNYLRQNPAL